MAPDDIFVSSLDTHLSWPIDTTRAYLASQADHSKRFDQRLREWMTSQDWPVIRSSAEEWSAAVDRAAQTLVHVLANRLIFYQALRARFRDLPRLQLRGIKTPAEAYAGLQRLFEKAMRLSGDYQTLLYPHEDDWAGRLVFEGEGALVAWQLALRGIENYDFSHIASDVVGKVFQRLVSPEERHRWGQHFTGDDVVDLVNAFCVREADDAVLDPACGSGSFLVRAYYRKRWLCPQKPHADLLGELFGCDIALYPAHLATLNLAAREINDEANYPRITRKDFFDIEPDETFCELPPHNTEVLLPRLGAVVGNPPYVRQEKIGTDEKEKISRVILRRWPGLRLSGRADIHCYFWPAAAALLREGGYFGFLTSSSWLDVEYGFALQRWILQNFKLIAVLESTAEPWFPDARVKSCITVLQRCNDAAKRMATLVKFVRVKRPLAEVIGCGADELEARFDAVESLRKRIEETTEDFEDESLRIVVKRQQDLWNEGLRAASVLSKGVPAPQAGEDEEDEETAGESTAVRADSAKAAEKARRSRSPRFRITQPASGAVICAPRVSTLT